MTPFANKVSAPLFDVEALCEIMHESIHPQKNNTKNSARGAEFCGNDDCATVEVKDPFSRRPFL